MRYEIVILWTLSARMMLIWGNVFDSQWLDGCVSVCFLYSLASSNPLIPLSLHQISQRMSVLRGIPNYLRAARGL